MFIGYVLPKNVKDTTSMPSYRFDVVINILNRITKTPQGSRELIQKKSKGFSISAPDLQTAKEMALQKCRMERGYRAAAIKSVKQTSP